MHRYIRMYEVASDQWRLEFRAPFMTRHDDMTRPIESVTIGTLNGRLTGS